MKPGSIKLLFSFLVLTIFIAGSCKTAKTGKLPADGNNKYVNTFIGTAPMLDPRVIGYTPPPNWRVWAGLTYPGTSLPNAMVQLSPITEYGTGAGYEYEDTLIHGFTHTNKGHWNLCNIPVLPVTGEPNHGDKYASSFTHARESAGPGFYNVVLADFNIEVNLTSTLRTGYHRYRFPANAERKIVFDLSRANNRVHAWQAEKVGNNALEGFQDIGNERVYFHAQLNTTISSLDITGNAKDQGMAVVHLGKGGQRVEMKIGLSYVSTANAKENLEAELKDHSFEEVRLQAAQVWDGLLSKIQVKGGTGKQKEMFYSSLYRAFLWPALRSDVNGDFTDAKKNKVNKGFRYYTVPSLWDTYRNKLVLLTLMAPDVTRDVIRSLKDRGEHTGFIPTFFHGDHAAPFIAGAYARGIKDFDVEGTYKLLLRNATIEGPSRPHLKEYIEKGFISDPHVERPHVETKAKAGVSKTLEYAYDDYSLAMMARQLGDSANYKMLMGRSSNFKNMFDPSTNFMRGRLENGNWIANFNPQYPYYEYMYREANAWHLSFFAPHDMKGLIGLYGNEKTFEAKLDSLFTLPWNPRHIARNVSGFIGQYCHGNQPDHEAPFSYYFINKPEKSQKILDTVMNHFYGIGEHGLALCGMDDAGEMSSWYVFTALGLYPFSPADTDYLVTMPLFDEVSWTLPNGKELRIRKTGKSRDLESITVNGSTLKGYFLSHKYFDNGGDIEVKSR